MNVRESLWRIAVALTVLAILNVIPALLVLGFQQPPTAPDTTHTFVMHMRGGGVFYCTPLVGAYLIASSVLGFFVMLFWAIRWRLSRRRSHG